MRVLLVVAILLAGRASVGCSQSCHDRGCPAGVTVHVVPKDGAFAPGTYSFEIGTGHETAQFECQIGTNESGCKSLTAAKTIWVSMNSQEATITIDSRPESISVRMERDQVTMFTDVVPQYSTVQPNGPDCEPTCTIADETLEI